MTMMLCCLFLLLHIQDDKPEGWLLVNIPNKGFTITMPKPERKAYQEQGPDRKLVHHSVYQAKADELVYTLHVFEYSSTFMEQPAKAILDQARTRAVMEVAGRLVSEKDIRYDQVPGREVLVDGKQKGFVYCRYYVFNQKVYLVSMTAPREADFTTEPALYFFSSFKLKPVKPGNVK